MQKCRFSDCENQTEFRECYSCWITGKWIKWPRTELCITLILSVTAGARMDSAIAKAAELGVQILKPYIANRSGARLRGETFDMHLPYWQRIAHTSCTESKRETMLIYPIDKIGPDASATKILLTPHTENLVSQTIPITGLNTITFAVGPDAGFDLDEERQFLEQGFVKASLGEHELRSETAAIAAVVTANVVRGKF